MARMKAQMVVKRFDSGRFGAIASMDAVADRLVFAVSNADGYDQVWTSDGTEAGTRLLKAFPTDPLLPSVSNGFYRRWRSTLLSSVDSRLGLRTLAE